MVWLCWPPKALSSISAGIAGTDEGAIIDVLTQRSNAQRQQILKAYKAHYGRVLLLTPLLLPPAPSHAEIAPCWMKSCPGRGGQLGHPYLPWHDSPEEDQVVNQPPALGASPA